MAVDGDIYSQTGICHLFFNDESPSFEVLDAGWKYDFSVDILRLLTNNFHSSGKYVSASMQGQQLHVFSHIAHGGLRWGSYTVSNLFLTNHHLIRGG